MGKGKAFPVPPARREGMEAKPRGSHLGKGQSLLCAPCALGERGVRPGRCHLGKGQLPPRAPGAVGGRGAMAAAGAMAALGRSLTVALRLPRARPGLPGYALRRGNSGTEGRARFQEEGEPLAGGGCPCVPGSVCPGVRLSWLRQPVRAALKRFPVPVESCSHCAGVSSMGAFCAFPCVPSFCHEGHGGGRGFSLSGDTTNPHGRVPVTFSRRPCLARVLDRMISGHPFPC